MNPHLLLPATTALGTIDPRGREKGILAGANVVMPNLSPVAVRKDYSLYDNKICTGEEAAECAGCLGRRLASIDYELVFSSWRLYRITCLSAVKKESLHRGFIGISYDMKKRVEL